MSTWVEQMVAAAEQMLVFTSASMQPWLFDGSKAMAVELEQFRQKDFSPMYAHMRELFPNSHKGMRLRPVPLASKVADDGAGQYNERVLRELSGVSEIQARTILQHLDDLQVDRVLHLAERQGVLQQSYLLGVWPDTSGRMRLVKFMPYQVVKIEFADPWARAAGDIRAATHIEVGVPIKRPERDGGRWMIRVVLEPGQAWYLQPGESTWRGLFEPGGKNPLGRVPIVATRREEPDGVFLPGCAQDVHGCSIGIVLALSDCEMIERESTIVPLYATGEGATNLPATIPLRPGQITPIPGDVQVQAVHMTPNTQNYLRAAAMVMKLLTQFRNLRPQGYEASIITGPAANIDREGFLEERQRQEQRCARLEQDLVELVVDVHNAMLGRALVLGQPKLKTRFRYTRTKENILQEAQARSILIQQGLWSQVEEVAEVEGISFEAAIELLELRLETWGKRFPQPAGATPGLDRSAAPTAPA